VVRLVTDALKEFIMVVYLIASRTGAEKPLSYLLCEAKALKIRLSLRMKFIIFYNLNIIKCITN
jgi:hypothetical protein